MSESRSESVTALTARRDRLCGPDRFGLSASQRPPASRPDRVSHGSESVTAASVKILESVAAAADCSILPASFSAPINRCLCRPLSLCLSVSLSLYLSVSLSLSLPVSFSLPSPLSLPPSYPLVPSLSHSPLADSLALSLSHSLTHTHTHTHTQTLSVSISLHLFISIHQCINFKQGFISLLLP